MTENIAINEVVIAMKDISPSEITVDNKNQ